MEHYKYLGDDYYCNNYEYAEYPTPREKYLKYRKDKSDKTSFEWQLKKDDLKFSKLSKKMKRYYANKKHYTWND